MSKNKKIKFIKVEADRPLLTFYNPKYETEPRLYLELLENKSKVKPHIRNTEWISNSMKGTVPSIYEARDYADNEITKENLISKSPVKSPREKPKIIDITNASDNDIKEFENRALRSRDERKDDLENISGSIKFGIKQKLKEQRSLRDRSDRDDRRRDARDDDRRRDDRDDDRRRDDRDNDRRRDDRDDDRRSDRDDRRSDRDDDRRSDRDDDKRSDRDDKKEESALSKMLKGDIQDNKVTTDKTNTLPVVNTTTNDVVSSVIPPSISEINEGKVQVDSNGVRNLDYITQDERAEQDIKKDMLVKFNILKKKHPYASIPTYSEHTDLATLQKDYKSVVKQIEVESKAVKYKTWLLWGYFGLEFILLNYASFDDIRGFYQQQYNSMNQYEDLLYELGEKTYMPDEKKWPVEIRLLMLMGTNMGMFVLGKMAEKRFGINPMNMFKSAPNYSQPQQETQQQTFTSTTTAPPKKKGISAPDFDFEDISQKKIN
jgi:hypothetical protein